MNQEPRFYMVLTEEYINDQYNSYSNRGLYKNYRTAVDSVLEKGFKVNYYLSAFDNIENVNVWFTSEEGVVSWAAYIKVFELLD